MLKRKLALLTCAVALLATIPAVKVSAQTPLDNRTYFTFSGPVELPNVVLPAGKYLFRIVDLASSRQVIQVASADQNKTYGLFITINAQRPTPPDDAEVRFMETASNAPPAIKTWWYPGTTIGREFIYPRAEARRLAQITKQPVLTTKADSSSSDEMKTAELSRVSPTGDDAQVTDERAPASTAPSGMSQSGNPTMNTADNDRAPVQTGQMAANTRTALPKTDTLLPLIGLLGLTSLAGSYSLRFRP